MSKPASIRIGQHGQARLLALVLLAAALLLTGCGYTTTELYPTQYNSVGVPHFVNQSEERGIAFELRESLIKEIEQRTPYKALAGTGLADTELTGTIKRVERRLVSRDATAGLPQEIEITVYIDFQWRDLRTGNTLRGFRGLGSSGQFVPNRTIGEFASDGRRLAVQRLAQDIVSRMREDGW